jgi:hypothetical protein
MFSSFLGGIPSQRFLPKLVLIASGCRPLGIVSPSQPTKVKCVRCHLVRRGFGSAWTHPPASVIEPTRVVVQTQLARGDERGSYTSGQMIGNERHAS